MNIESKEFMHKLNKFNTDIRVSSLVDVIELYYKYRNTLDEFCIDQIREIFSYTGIDRLKYVIKSKRFDAEDKQEISIDKLYEDFIELIEELGIG